MISRMKNSPVLVSVIIPTRNRKELLLYAIQSVVQQTYKNLQIIIHDNNSSDGTPNYLAERVHDDRIEYYHTDHDLVMTENWNTAFRYVHGEYFVRLDDDNIFFKNFIERALQVIQEERLDVISFSPLIVHLQRKVFPLFTPEHRTYILNKYQSLYLEYRALTDSNYTLYRTGLIKKLFPNGNVYRGSLPDRFMNYTIADAMNAENLRVGVSSEIKGVTRFDYRDSYPADFQLQFVDYVNVTRESVKMEMNVHNNFSLHRVMTIREFFEHAKDLSLRQYFERFLTPASMFVTVLRMGHILRITSTYSLKEYFIYLRYAVLIFGALLRSPRAFVEGRPAWTLMVNIAKKLLAVTFATAKNLITRRHERKLIANPDPGDTLVKDFLDGRAKLENFPLTGAHGDLGILLKQGVPSAHR